MDFSAFMKKNKVVRPHQFFPASRDFLDLNGEPIKWELRALTTEENETLQAECTHDVPVPGKKGQFRSRMDPNEYLAKVTAAAVVFPDLNNAELQNSYGVMNPVDLLKRMLDRPGEFNALRDYVVEMSGFSADLGEEVEEAKN